MSVWLTIPSARPNGGTATTWKKAGYRVALWRDQEDGVRQQFSADGLVIVAPYPGYAQAVNALCKAVLEIDRRAEWCVAGGDDTLPDPNHAADQIARECGAHFAQLNPRLDDCTGSATFGVMQPTGDLWSDALGKIIDRICGSPWLGRDFCQRMYGGVGPLFEGWRHMFVDEELQQVAIKLGVLWQRPDLIHLHNHFARESSAVDARAVQRPIPAHLIEANSPEHWQKYKALFQSRQAAGFPGHEPVVLECAR